MKVRVDFNKRKQDAPDNKHCKINNFNQVKFTLIKLTDLNLTFFFVQTFSFKCYHYLNISNCNFNSY